MWGRTRSETGDWRLKIERLRVERLRHRPRHGHGHGTALILFFMDMSRVRTLRLRTPKHDGRSTEVYRRQKDGDQEGKK